MTANIEENAKAASQATRRIVIAPPFPGSDPSEKESTRLAPLSSPYSAASVAALVAGVFLRS